MKAFLALALFLLLPITAIGAEKGDCDWADHGADQLSNMHWPVKGGVAIINTHLYIVMNGANNKLLLDDHASWKGQANGQPEVVVFYQNKVWPQDRLPANFDMRQAILVSFEANSVRFFDFAKAEGGCYVRTKAAAPQAGSGAGFGR